MDQEQAKIASERDDLALRLANESAPRTVSDQAESATVPAVTIVAASAAPNFCAGGDGSSSLRGSFVAYGGGGNVVISEMGISATFVDRVDDEISEAWANLSDAERSIAKPLIIHCFGRVLAQRVAA